MPIASRVTHRNVVSSQLYPSVIPFALTLLAVAGRCQENQHWTEEDDLSIFGCLSEGQSRLVAFLRDCGFWTRYT